MSEAQTMPTDRYAVFGHPIAHSKSPRIHSLFAEQTGQALIYTAELVPLDGLSVALDEFQAAGGKGVNITVPFKQEAWARVTARSSRAERAGAVNTIAFRPDGARYGDTTDGIGLVRDLIDNHRVTLAGRRVLLLGAGGAARGVLEPLLGQSPAKLVIANRTVDKAIALARDFADLGEVRGCGFQQLSGHSFEVIINATSAGLEGAMPILPDSVLARGGTAYDMMYSDVPTVFVRWAMDHDAGLALDGLGMLVEQAAEAFYLWRKVRPDTGSVIAQLRGTPADQ